MNSRLKYLSPVSILPEYEFDRPVIFLSETVVSEKLKSQLNGSPFEIMPEIWKEQDRLIEARVYLNKVYERLQEKIVLVLNRIHGVNYPPSFWEIPMATWLYIFLHILFDRYSRLKTAIKNYGSENSTLLVCKYEFDISDINGNAINFSKNFAIIEQKVSAFYGEVARQMGVSVLEFILNKPIENPKSLSHDKLRRLFSLTYSRVFNKLRDKLLPPIPLSLLGGEDILIKYFHGFNRLDKFVFSRKLKVSFFPNNKKIKILMQKIDRSKLLSIKAEDDFENIVIKVLPKFMPTYLLEEFESYRQYAKKWSSFKIYLSDVAWDTDILFCYAAALGKLKGAKIIGVQHGGGYGQYRESYHEYIERKISNYFITWGWKDSFYNGAQLLPLPVPQLSSNFNQYTNKFPFALLAGNELPRHLYRFQPMTFMPHYAFQYLKDSRNFVSKLSINIRKCLIYRPFPHDMGWLDERMHLFKDFPEVRVEFKGPITDLLRKAKLYIGDHQSTIFMEAFAMNTPTVLFWEFNSDNERETATPYFDLLRKAGILFHDPCEAAEHVNAIWHDVQGWWRQPEVQKAKDEFCHQFARTSKNWRKEWVEFLKGLTNKGSMGHFIPTNRHKGE